jgi:prepilin-type N-terminal cleavage/methylation domain-containing protein
MALRTRLGRPDLGQQPDDGGFTLIELVVAMIILGVVLGGGFLLLTGAIRTAQATSSRVTDINNARLAAAAMSRTLRTAVLPSQLDDSASAGTITAAFIQGGPTSVQFYADIGNPATLPSSGNTTYGPSQVTYSLSAGVLTQTIQPPLSHDVNNHDYQYCTPGPGCQVFTTVLARGVDANTTTKPLFVYYDANGASLGALSATNLDDVDSIDIRVGMDTVSTGPMGTTSITTRVSLPNHESLLRNGSSS